MKFITSISITLGLCISATSVAGELPQAGANPLVIDQTAKIDNITYLMAAGAKRSDTIALKSVGSSAKHGWLKHFDDMSEFLEWQVQLDEGKKYQVTVLMDPKAENQRFRLQVANGEALNFEVQAKGWQRVTAGSLYLPKGEQSLKFTRTTGEGDLEIKSIELIAEEDVPSYNNRVAELKSKDQKFSKYKYGVMFQYGGWAYPISGPKKTLEQQAADTDIDKLVNVIKQSGADYVIWSTSWVTYELNAPITSVDRILGHSDRTSSRDVYYELADALDREGIDFYFYYHVGHSRYIGADWWNAQIWPSSYYKTGLGDRSVFFNNWKSVISEMSNRYGTLLDGWFFDDGISYYPAPFESLTMTAKEGNPDRIVSYNNWEAAHYTEFEDISFGELCRAHYAEHGYDGIYQKGSDAGLQGHCMTRLEDDWGIYRENQAISLPRYSLKSASNTVLQRAAMGVPTTFNLMMYEDGSVSPESLELMARLRSTLDSRQQDVINDDNQALIKVGKWGKSSNRGVGDYNDDVSYTRINGDYLEYSFYGTSINITGPKYHAMGEVEVFIDGISQGIINAYDTSFSAQQTYYFTDRLAPGAHTVKVVKKSGDFMAIDKLEVDSRALKYNDNRNNIFIKTGSWGSSTNRGVGNYGDDVSYTRTNGDYVEIKFTGTDITLLGESSKDSGEVEIFIDNVSQGVVDTRTTERLIEQTIFKVSDLPLGTHVLKAVKRSGNFMVIDSVEFK